MTDKIKSIKYAYPDRIPVFISFLPATWLKYGTELNRIRADFPEVFGNVNDMNYAPHDMKDSYRAGTFTDIWGCVWSNVREGYDSIVVDHPLKEREDIHAFKAPDTDMGLPHGFMFLRLFDLRGFEEMMVDFAEEPPELQMLIDKVRDYNVRQMEILVSKSTEQLIHVGDDNGMQHALPISPEKWRKYIKPAYKAIFDVAKKQGKLIYMHTDGCIYQVMQDMQEAGADIINPQIRANGLDNLERVCKGKIPICLDLDRQLFPFATPEEIEAHIDECVKRMYMPEGGLWLLAECAADVPLENIRAIARALTRAATYKL